MRKLKQATQREKARKALKDKGAIGSPGPTQPRDAKADSASRRNGHAASPGDPDGGEQHGKSPSSKVTRH